MYRFFAPLLLVPLLLACDPLPCDGSDDVFAPETDLGAPSRPSPVTEVVVRSDDTRETLRNKIRHATILGTLQSDLIEAGEVMGPCKHDAANVYHYCSQGTDPDAPRLCAVPQEPGIEHASVCVERQIGRAHV